MSIRFRNALLTSILMATLLLALSVGVYVIMGKSLQDQSEARLWRVYTSVIKDPKVFQLVAPPIGPALRFHPDEIDAFAAPGLYIQVVDRAGTVQGQAPAVPDDAIRVPARVLEDNAAGEARYFEETFRGQPWRVLSAPIKGGDGLLYGTMQVADPLTSQMRTLAQLRLLLLAGTGMGIVLSAIGALLLTGRALRPLAKITTTAREIGHAGDLSQRIESPQTRDEVQHLAETFNEMLQQLENSFAAEARFVSDASHELRTPLTALRGNAEILLRQLDAGRIEPADLKEGLSDIRDEAERMGRLVHNLLTLARADVGWRPELSRIHLDQVVADAARVATPLAGERQFTVDLDGDLDVLGNADQLKQLLLILIDNAVTYTPEGGRIHLAVRRAGDEAEITVQDTGPGIAPEQLERVFDRFYRGAVAREHGAAGAGLGLAIGRWIVDCHNGSIVATSEPGQGTTFTVRIPQAPVDDSDGVERPPARHAAERAAALSQN